MPLRLKFLELHGYKTFAAKTSFEFADGITAIVGPNGSGKSNIADALRWVLGEQSYSLLRAKKTEDMIFAGSEQRPRAGMASALITFDNADGWLPVDFSEVALARRAYRDGRNEYVLNSQHVRLKDINELLAQSGLSERTYTILGQGLVDASLALKADDRRRLFEEAAGIGLYRSRREESLHKLETTQRNLDRVMDILAELEPRMKSLERQAARAQEYAQVQADLRLLLKEWYGFHWHHAQRDLADLLELSRAQETRLNEARETYQGIRQEFTAYYDHLNGLRARLNSWHRQSAQLHEKREAVSGDLAMLDERHRSLMDNHQSRSTEQVRLFEEHRVALDRLSELDAETGRLQGEFEEAGTQMDSAQADLTKRQAVKLKLEQDHDLARSQLADLSAQQIRLHSRLDELASASSTEKQKLDDISAVISSAETELKNASQEYREAAALQKNAEAAVTEAEAALEAAQKRFSELEEQVRKNQAAGAALEADKARLEAQLEVLEQAENDLAGYAEGARLLLDAARQSRLQGVRGALSANIDVPAQFEVAIAAVLGEYTDAVLLTSGDKAEIVLEMLRADGAGRASILPLDWLVPAEPLKLEREPGVFGVASELVRAPAELRPALDLLLGQVAVVEDHRAARHLLVNQPKNVRAVTLRGEVFHGSGPVVAGQPAKAAALARPRQRRELNEAGAGLDRQIGAVVSNGQLLSGKLEVASRAVTGSRDRLADVHRTLDKARSGEQQAQVRHETTLRQRDWQIEQKQDLDRGVVRLENEMRQATAKLAEIDEQLKAARDSLNFRASELAKLNLDEYQQQVTFLGTRAAVAERALQDARSQLNDRKQAVARLDEQLASLENLLKQIDESLTGLADEREAKRSQAAAMNTQLEELRTLIDPAEKEFEAAEMLEAELQKKEADAQSVMVRIERNYNQIQLDLGRKQESLQNLRQKIEDDFGLVAFEYETEVSGPVPLPFDGMVEQLPVVSDLAPDLEEHMTRQRAQLRRMGAVNPEAQQEYRSVKERHGFLTGQVEDLRKAEADLHKVIAELDELTRQEFQKTFVAVAEHFHLIFHRLFGGGSARLTLTDPDNLTETGIDIEARLPGRREQGLSLLSGGERSLTAIALVFALLKVSPTPVCVMDEVDAMLDEANVGRFRELLMELSQDTQFIIITHNRNTVQGADVIYGVTMGRDSSSQVISLKLDQVSENYLK